LVDVKAGKSTMFYKERVEKVDGPLKMIELIDPKKSIISESPVKNQKSENIGKWKDVLR